MSLLGGLFGKAPKPPDPTKTANAQWGYTQQAGDTTLKNNAMDKTGPFGSSSFETDPTTGLPTGINTSFSQPMQGGVNNITGAFGAQSGGLPTGIDFSGINTGDILNAGMNSYDAYANPMVDRQLNDVRTRMSERGLPEDSQISGDSYGDVYDAANRSRTSYYGQLAGQLPGMESTMTNTAIAQGMAPGQMAGQSLGLLSGAGSLLPQAQQPQAGYAAPDYASLVNNNYNQQMQQYQSDQAGLGNLLKTGAGLLMAPMTGGMSLGMTGAGMGGLFNGGTGGK